MYMRWILSLMRCACWILCRSLAAIATGSALTIPNKHTPPPRTLPSAFYTARLWYLHDFCFFSPLLPVGRFFSSFIIINPI